jgi:hypothetical protein
MLPRGWCKNICKRPDCCFTESISIKRGYIRRVSLSLQMSSMSWNWKRRNVCFLKWKQLHLEYTQPRAVKLFATSKPVRTVAAKFIAPYHRLFVAPARSAKDWSSTSWIQDNFFVLISCDSTFKWQIRQTTLRHRTSKVHWIDHRLRKRKDWTHNFLIFHTTAYLVPIHNNDCSVFH